MNTHGNVIITALVPETDKYTGISTTAKLIITKKNATLTNFNIENKILQTNKYGGYTNRKRIIMVAVRNDIEGEYIYPEEQDTNNTLIDALNLIDYNGINNPSIDEDNKPMKHTQKTIKTILKNKDN
jgi:site-specific DNA-cytosine methylase